MSISVEAALPKRASRHVLTPEEAARGGQATATRRRRFRDEEARKRRRWLRTDAQLWAAYLDAQSYGSDAECQAAQEAWREHHRKIPAEALASSKAQAARCTRVRSGS